MKKFILLLVITFSLASCSKEMMCSAYKHGAGGRIKSGFKR